MVAKEEAEDYTHEGEGGRGGNRRRRAFVLRLVFVLFFFFLESSYDVIKRFLAQYGTTRVFWYHIVD